MDKRPHEKLDVWERSVEFVERIYEITRMFPDSERYGLISQLRRAAVSIPANVAEGASRQSRKEFIQFFYVARGSLSESETLIHIALRLKLLEPVSYTEFRTKTGNIGKMLTGLIASLRKRPSFVSRNS